MKCQYPECNSDVECIIKLRGVRSEVCKRHIGWAVRGRVWTPTPIYFSKFQVDEKEIKMKYGPPVGFLQDKYEVKP